MGQTTVSDYLTFTKVGDTGKTLIVAVNSRHHGNRLGLIRWYGPWRQYVFYPGPGTLFNKGCLQDIMAVCDKLMQDRRTAQ